ncbi:MAG TPA: type II toxin-antitoxin system HicB family antitoxin, partial [Stellaceae bacterium]|nr:type II toxin-antitoxin system HicB family antitoxin [Stellaceae bacterium]
LWVFLQGRRAILPMHGSRKEMRRNHPCHQEAARPEMRCRLRAYPATLIADPDGGFTVTFRDVPEAITEGDSREEALLRAEDALESALAMYVAAKQPLPAPSETTADEVAVPLSALGMAKTALYDAMREQSVGRAELARRLRWHLPQVNRVLDLRHASRMEHVEAALAALGLRLIVDVARAA